MKFIKYLLFAAAAILACYYLLGILAVIGAIAISVFAILLSVLKYVLLGIGLYYLIKYFCGKGK